MLVMSKATPLERLAMLQKLWKAKHWQKVMKLMFLNTFPLIVDLHKPQLVHEPAIEIWDIGTTQRDQKSEL